MTLEDLGNLGEFVAALGVGISLGYLAIQIRQNTAQLEQNTSSVRAAAFQSLVAERSGLLALTVPAVYVEARKP